MRGTLDVLRRIRIFRRPVEAYAPFNSYNLVVGLGRVPASFNAERLTCGYAILQADNANGGFINIGGPQVTVLNGIELGAGAAILLSVTSDVITQRAIAGSLGASLLPYLAEPDLQEYARMMQPYKILLDLSQVFVVATLAAQNLRVLYSKTPE